MNSQMIKTKGYGSISKVSFSEISVLGLLTFWIYTVYKIKKVISHHFKERLKEMNVIRNENGNSAPALQEELGFNSYFLIPNISILLFLMSGASVVSVFFIWSVLGQTQSYSVTMIEMGSASVLFYCATVIIFLWALKILKDHEFGELILRDPNIDATIFGNLSPSDQLIERWEAKYQKIYLFLVLALPMVFAPTYGTHLFLTNQLGNYPLLPAFICFGFAAIYHLWGSSLLTGLFNSHLEFERSQILGEASNTNSSDGIDKITVEEVSTSTGPDGSLKQPVRTLAAIMLTDMVGYSKAMEKDEQATYQKLVIHNEIIRKSIEHHHGKEVKTIGDAFLAMFPSAMSAVDCAISIQEAFGDYNQAHVDDERIVIRIGIHIGDVLVTDDDIYGDGVNVVSRIEPLADPGGICVSEEVYTLVRKRIELKVEQLKNPALKNISIAPVIYKVHFASS